MPTFAELLGDKALDSIMDENQKRSLKRDQAKRDADENRARKKQQQDNEHNFGRQDNRKKGKGGNGGGKSVGRNLPPVFADRIHGTYGAGKMLDAPVASKPQDTATAPYNFIPLPHAILPSQLDDALREILLDGDGKEKTQLSREEEQAVRQAFHAFRTQGKHYSGAIRLSIEALTPLYVGGMDGKASFSPAGSEIIPGSELRGMTKNLFKMLTCGNWRAGEDMVDRHLYYRSLIVSKPNPQRDQEGTPQNYGLHNLYAAHMVGEDAEGNPVKKVSPGFLVQRGSAYCIYPLKNGAEDMHSIIIKDYIRTFKLHDNDVKKSAVRWQGKTAYVQVGVLNPRKLKTKEDIDKFFETTQKSQWFRIGKQRYRYFSTEAIDAATCYELPEDIVQEYRDDKNRRGVNLMDKSSVIGTAPSSVPGLAPFDSIVPCFFLAEGSTVKAFGHGQSFRIPYDHSTMDAVPAALKMPVIDFADAVFGRAGKAVSWASRVAFEDAPIVRKRGCEDEGRTHFLMQPNPTSFQLYLRQNAKDELVHWDTPGARIRGYKMYWHNKDGHRWQVNQAEQALLAKRRGESTKEGDKGELGRVITPLKAGATFEGQIRFRDLTAEELGALLAVYHLADSSQESIACKIGMGKSIGFGSVAVHAKLLLECEDAYEKLFDADGWNETLRSADAAPFLHAFEAYGKRVSSSFASDYEATCTALRSMMDFGHTSLANWEPATAAIDGNMMEDAGGKTANRPNDTRFLKRNILPDVKTVVNYAENGV